MNAKVLFILTVVCLATLVAWLVWRPAPAPSDDLLQKFEVAAAAPEGPVKSPSSDGGGECEAGAHPVAHADETSKDPEVMIGKGLEYLVKNQAKDGHWESDGGKHPVAMTALVGMALLMERSNVKNGKYSDNIRKAAHWLMDQSQAEREG